MTRANFQFIVDFQELSHEQEWDRQSDRGDEIHNSVS